MSVHVTISDENGVAKDGFLNRFPDKCPVCSKQGQPSFRMGVFKRDQGNFIFQCPIFECRSLYVAIYLVICRPNHNTICNCSLNGSGFPYFTESHHFPPNIEAISPESCKMFNQALTAE